MNTEKMKLVKKFGGRNVMLPIGACALICSAAMATCWVTPLGPACGTNQAADPTNDCQAINCSPLNSTYCDSRDGECGLDGSCTVSQVTELVAYLKGTKVQLPNGSYVCDMVGASLNVVSNGTCAQATITGNKCGYCP